MHVATEQDEGLEALSQALRRQKQMGIAIGQEADSQIGLIDGIADRTERVSSRVERQTERVSKMRERAGLCIPWTVAVPLLIVILIIAVVPINGKP